MPIFMITITARGERGHFETHRNTRIVHMGFITAPSLEDAQKRADAMCKALDPTRNRDEPQPFSAETYSGERNYHAEVAGEGNLIRVGEFDD